MTDDLEGSTDDCEGEGSPDDDCESNSEGGMPDDVEFMSIISCGKSGSIFLSQKSVSLQQS